MQAHLRLFAPSYSVVALFPEIHKNKYAIVNMSIPFSILFHVLLDLVYVIYAHSSQFPCKNNDVGFTM